MYTSFTAARHGVLRSSVIGLLLLGTATLTSRAAVLGNIDPLNIEIDTSADLYPNSGLPGFVDWVKDSLPNTDSPSLIDSIATGLIPNVSAAAGGSGHWHGVRIVDGIAGGDQNIFLTGGKENDTTTWNIGPGTVGSSKYDITQAYLANNDTKLFFGMERRGNNGTTAFDFEFNRLPPSASAPLVPTRSVGDVLFTFEMTGSGNTGSATPHYFVWNGSKYVEQIPAPPSLISSINGAETPAAPWGFVNSKGDWELGNLSRFSFAEASVSLADAFPGLDLCNGARAFVQVRTRSSVTETSDLKDTTKIFEFLFGGPDADVALGTDCLPRFSFNGTGSKDSSGGTDLTYSWDFVAPAGVTLSGAGVTGPDQNGAYHSTQSAGAVDVAFPAGLDSVAISAKLTVTQGTSCTSSKEDSIVVLRPVSASGSLSINCLPEFGFSASGSTAGDGVAYSWDFVAPAGVTLSGAGVTGPDPNGAYHSSAFAGTVNVGFPAGVDSASIQVKLTVTRGDCSDDAQQNVTVLRPLEAVITQKISDGNTLSVNLTGSAPTATSLQWQRRAADGTWVNIPGATGSTLSYASFEADSAPVVRNFNIDGAPYAGKLFEVAVRLHAERVVQGVTCEANSAPAIIKKVIAVDP
jgi:hypothetical protein